MSGEELRIEYVPLSQALEWDWEENPKKHDIGGLVESIWRYGFQDPPKYDAALDRFVYGNGRVQAVAWGKKEGREPPRGIKIENGEWMIPVKFGIDIETVSEARAFAIDHNNQTLMGGDLTAWDVAQIWDGEGYLALLSELAMEDVLPVSVDGNDLDALMSDIGMIDAWEGEGTDTRTSPSHMVIVNISKFSGAVRLGDLASIPERLIERFGNGDDSVTSFLEWVSDNL